MREHLPATRKSITHKLVLQHQKVGGKMIRLHVYITVGLFPDGKPAELFLQLDNSEDTISGFCKVWAIAVSLCLQSGVTLDKLCEKFLYQDFPPHGFTENKDIHSCTSIVDYVMKWMKLQFINLPTVISSPLLSPP
jgi:ribonucleoside-diphosphate reductase alpha chain